MVEAYSRQRAPAQGFAAVQGTMRLLAAGLARSGTKLSASWARQHYRRQSPAQFGVPCSNDAARVRKPRRPSGAWITPEILPPASISISP